MTTTSIFDANLEAASLTALKNDGLNAVDINVGAGALIDWDDHINQAGEVHKQLQEHELQCAIVRSQADIEDIDIIVKAVEVAHALNCEYITIAVPTYDGSNPYRSSLGDARGCYQDLNQISSETGIDSLIEIKSDSICPNADAAMRILEGLDPSQVGALFNPGLCSDVHDVKRSVDVLGPFLRSLTCTPDINSDLLKAALDAIDSSAEGIFLSVQAETSNASSVLNLTK